MLVVGRFRARGKGSGVPVERDIFHVWTFAGGKATKLHAFDGRQEAMDAAGIRSS